MRRSPYLRERVADGLAFAVVTLFVTVPLAGVEMVERGVALVRSLGRK